MRRVGGIAAALLLAGARAAIQHIAACNQLVHQAGHRRFAQLCNFCQPCPGDANVLVNQLINLPKISRADQILCNQTFPAPFL